VFTRSGTVWSEQARLVASDGATFDEFGNAVAVSGDTVLVGCQLATVAGNNSQGAAYLFTRSATQWSTPVTLLAPDGAAFDRFGLSVALSGDTALVGAVSASIDGIAAQGAAYVFVHGGADWAPQAKLSAADGESYSGFGYSAALDDDTALIGAISVGDAGQGAAYVFVRSSGAWSQQAKLTADDAWFGDEFGSGVGLSGDNAVVGAIFADPDGIENGGAAYRFARANGAWSQQEKLVAADNASGAEFGIGAALAGGTAVVGAESAQVDGDWKGAAYVFVAPAGTCNAPIVENFDAVALPALPPGWTFTAAQGSGPWQTVADFADSAPNAAWVADQATPSDLRLDSPVFVPQAGSLLTFRQRFDFESTYDGGVLEISIAGGAFADIIAAGGSFVAGGYTATMQGSSAIAGRDAWTGDSGGAFVTTTIAYPPAAIGQPVRLRWRAASDVTVGHGGWWIDTLTLGCSDGAPPAPIAQIGPDHFAFALSADQTASEPLAIGNAGAAGSVLHFDIGEAADDCGVPADVPWLDASPASGDVAASASTTVTVMVDATGLAAGHYAALLCMATSDPSHPQVTVPVTLDVGVDAADTIFSDGFDAP
jgi:hypothetical protein